MKAPRLPFAALLMGHQSSTGQIRLFRQSAPEKSSALGKVATGLIVSIGFFGLTGRMLLADDLPSLTVTGGTVTEGNVGTVPLSFTVKLSTASSLRVTVTAKTVTAATVPATASADYAALPPTTL